MDTFGTNHFVHCRLSSFGDCFVQHLGCTEVCPLLALCLLSEVPLHVHICNHASKIMVAGKFSTQIKCAGPEVSACMPIYM